MADAPDKSGSKEEPSGGTAAIQKSEPPERSSRSLQAVPRPPEWFEKFLEVQQQELRVRSEEVGVRKTEADHAHEFSIKSLDAEAADRKDEREKKLEEHRNRHRLAILGMIIAAAVLAFLVWQGKDKLAEEIVKAAVYVVSAGFGGYAWGKHKGAQRGSQDDPPDSAR